MSNNRTWTSVLIALLGVVVGVLLMQVIQAGESRKKIKAEYREWRKLNLVLQSVSDNYVDTIDYKKVSEAAIEAALSKLDPHSLYLPPQELQDSETDLQGRFEGIGIQFNVPNDTAIVLEVIPGGPAEKIGMQKGDRIIKVDDKVIAGVNCPQDSMVRRMKGPSGTKVLISVLREGNVIPFEITRAKIRTNSIDAFCMVDDTTGYIRLAKFALTTTDESVEAIVKLKAQGMKKLIFDLRDNSGGYFAQALTLASVFFNNHESVVYTEGLRRKKEEYKAENNGFFADLPLVVLINEGSASSSEIFAGAIQDNDRGVIIGRRSYGKGLVQEPFYFTDGSGVRITVARFHTPSGRCIQKPYADDYAYDIYKRYADGEMLDADSIKVNKELEYHTKAGRVVYGGGGIIPDVFVPIDTTRATKYYTEVTKKATPMRFASSFFDAHKEELSAIGEYDKLLEYLDNSNLPLMFRVFASTVDRIKPADETEWNNTESYLMTMVRALVARYSQLGENAFYHIYLDIDPVVKEAMKPQYLEINTKGK